MKVGGLKTLSFPNPASLWQQWCQWDRKLEVSDRQTNRAATACRVRISPRLVRPATAERSADACRKQRRAQSRAASARPMARSRACAAGGQTANSDAPVARRQDRPPGCSEKRNDVAQPLFRAPEHEVAGIRIIFTRACSGRPACATLRGRRRRRRRRGRAASPRGALDDCCSDRPPKSPA